MKRPAAIALLLAGCSGAPPPGPTGTSCVDRSKATGAASFAKDVIPIFQLSCTSEVCHGSAATTPEAGLVLGKPIGMTMSPTEIAAVYANLVGAPSTRSSLPRVAAHDANGSWLMAKLEYDDFADCAAIADSCQGRCGVRMPDAEPPLSEAKLQTVAAWINAGAQND